MNMSSPTEASSAYISEQTCANWAKLNPDLLNFISKKLCDISDFIMFRAVCKGWRRATNISDPPLQFPCLIEWPCNMGSTLRIYSLDSQRTHTFCVPNTSFFGPAGNNVMVRHHSDVFHLSYLNPFTRVRKRVSFGEKFHRLKPCHVGFSSRTEEFFFVSCLVYDVFFFKRQGEDHWTGVRANDLRSAAYYKNQYFLLKKGIVDYNIVTIDKTGIPELSPIPFPVKGFCYNYVVTTTDSLLAVGATFNESHSQFEVHRLDNYPQKPQWTKLSGIGDSMLFVDHRGCFSLNASDYSGFKGNSIYFVCRSPINSVCTSKHSIWRFDMELKTSIGLPGPSWSVTSAVQAAWFVPSMLPEPPRYSSTNSEG